jgi:hypothetical protein
VYLTLGDVTIPVEIKSQEAARLVFVVPAGAKPARMRLMVLTAGNDATLLEQPVVLEVLQ